MKTVSRCGIYKDRPKVCRDYPKIDSYTPGECTYTFPSGGDGPREGGCDCEVGACCSGPREGGEPGGTPLPEAAGGLPCKHLVWEDVAEDQEKTAGVCVGPDELLAVTGHEQD